MKEKHFKLDELKQQANDQLVTVKNDIVDLDYDLKRIKEDIMVDFYWLLGHVEFWEVRRRDGCCILARWGSLD